GVHAMLAWKSALLKHQTVGVALADTRIEQFMQGVLQEVQAGLAQTFPDRAEDLTRLSQSFVDSCEHAYKDPCERVARDPLRKLSLNERVLGSIATNLKYGLATQYLQQGVVYGLVYAIQENALAASEVQEFIKAQLSLMAQSFDAELQNI